MSDANYGQEAEAKRRLHWGRKGKQGLGVIPRERIGKSTVRE